MRRRIRSQRLIKDVKTFGIALACMEAPKFKLRFLKSGHSRMHSDFRGNTIFWRMQDGITGLLHEIGHCKLEHWQADDCATRIAHEIEAWVKAEALAEEWGLRFDYRSAERAFRTYSAARHTSCQQANHAVFGRCRINWRYRGR